jgi:hypothetical protein
VATAFLAALTPAGIEASLQAAEQLEADHDGALAQGQRQLERARYDAQRAERRYRAVDPENRLVARGVEAEWETCLHAVDAAQTELARRQQQRPRALSPEDRAAVLALGTDLERVWDAPTTIDRDRKELLRTLLEEVMVVLTTDKMNTHLTIRWRGGLTSTIDLPLSTRRVASLRTDDDTIELVRRLAAHYPDAVLAGILNRQGRTTATGQRFNTNHVGNLRRHWKIPRFEPPIDPPAGDLLTIADAAAGLGIAPSTLHRWLNDGFVAGEQLTPGTPWRIRLTAALRARFVEAAPQGYVPMLAATRLLGVTRQTVLQRVKRGELSAVHVRCGRRKGLRIKVPEALPDLFGLTSRDRG